MLSASRRIRHWISLLLAACALALALPFALAADPATDAPADPSESFAVNLVNRLVQRGALTAADGAELLKLAAADTARAKAGTGAAPAAAATPGAPAQAPDAATETTDDTIRVAYVPDNVKAQLREEIKNEVMAQARQENWAAPRTFPEWVSRFTFFGDVRFRYEGDFYPAGNDNSGAFPNFNSINTGAPFDVAGSVFSPQYNVDQDRNRFRLRARLGAEVKMTDGFSSGFRIGTGENDSPVTENQTLGGANSAQGGDFSKYAIWLDRAFIKYDIGGMPERDYSVTVGRFENPFFATRMIWSDDLGFDGAVLKAKKQIVKGLTPFATIGAFPVFNTDLNFASNQPGKFASEDKWLYAAQVGATLEVTKDVSAKGGAALYYFDNVQGKLSSPFTPLTTSDAGNTDDTRPAFAQTGNTYMALRDIVPNALNNFGAIDQFQYFGLATPFHELAFTGQLDFTHFAPFQVSLGGEYENNIAYHKGAVSRIAVNNLGGANSGGIGSYTGGNSAYIVTLKGGAAAILDRGDWNVDLSYRYVESDSVVDGFTDADFGGSLLGTNHKGYTIGGNLGLAPGIWVGMRWMSADEIAGPTYRNDLLQMDINSKF